MSSSPQKHVNNIIDSVESGIGQMVGFGGDVVNEFVNTVLGAVSGVVDGANSVTKSTGEIVNMVLHDVVGERTTRLFHGAGGLAKRVSDALGDTVTHIPVVGPRTAYLVQRVGDGVYHVIVSTGNIAESATRRMGELVQRGADLVIFTLNTGKKQMLEVGKDVTDAVSLLTRGKKPSAAVTDVKPSSSRRSSKNRGGHRKKTRQQRQRGGSKKKATTGRRRRHQRGGSRTVLPIEYFGGDSGAYTAQCGRQTFGTAYGDSVPTSFGTTVEGLSDFAGPNLAPGGTYSTNMTTGIQTGGGAKRRYRRRSN